MKNCPECGILCTVCTHTVNEIFVMKLDRLIEEAPEDIVTFTISGNLFSKNYSFNILKPNHIEGCWV